MIGVMECLSNGVMVKIVINQKELYFYFFQYSNTPVLLYSRNRPYHIQQKTLKYSFPIILHQHRFPSLVHPFLIQHPYDSLLLHDRLNLLDCPGDSLCQALTAVFGYQNGILDPDAIIFIGIYGEGLVGKYHSRF